MPDVIDMQYTEAQKTIRNAFKEAKITNYEIQIAWMKNTDLKKAGKVIDQSPSGGRKIKAGEDKIIVRLYVLEGKATPTPTKAPKPSPSDKTFEAFVERLYTVALNRASDPQGKKYWVNKVEKEGATGADCARYFLLDAPEFMNRGLSVEDFVETLYKTFFDRASDAAGKKGWVNAIKSGKMTRTDVVNNFIESTEWCNVCAAYGVKSGAKYHKATVASKNAIEFATRLYTCCLKRKADADGVKYWSLALTNLEKTGCDATREFFTSKEFVDAKTSNEEYVKRLYTTFMGRDAEASEIQYWAALIKNGQKSRNDVLAFFGQSDEFSGICKKYGIERGTI